MQITKMTIIRTVLLLLGLINMILTVIGKSPLPISDQQMSDFISCAWVLGASIWAWWKNNSFTPEAIKADEYLDLLRNNEWLGESTDDALYYEDDDEDEPEEEDGDEKTN